MNNNQDLNNTHKKDEKLENKKEPRSDTTSIDQKQQKAEYKQIENQSDIEIKENNLCNNQEPDIYKEEDHSQQEYNSELRKVISFPL